MTGVAQAGGGRHEENGAVTEGMSVREPARDVPIVSEVDVVVVGAGTAGVMAAVGAARAGARVCVIEQSASPGGAIGSGMIGLFGNFFVDGQRQIIAGGPQELVERVVAADGAPLKSFDEAFSTGRLCIYFNHERASQVCLEMMKEAGVEMWFLSMFAAAAPAPGGGYDVIFESKGGRKAIRARQVVDCSGEADVAAAVGAPMLASTDRSWGLLFKLTHVDVDRFAQFLSAAPAACPEWTGWLARLLNVSEEQLRKDPYWGDWLDGGKRAWPWRHEIMKAVETGDFALVRDLPGGGRIRYGWDGFGPEPWHGVDMVAANVCMVTGLDPGDARSVSKAEVAARTYAFEFLAFLRKYLPGFEHAVIQTMGGRTISRGGREIIGECGLRGTAPYAGAANPDAVCLARGVPAGLPLGMFVPKGVKDMLVAGKCATGAYAVRASVNCMAMGYSCGILSAVAALRRTTPMELPVAERQTALKRLGVLLEPVAPRVAVAPLRVVSLLPNMPDADVDEGAKRAKKLS